MLVMMHAGMAWEDLPSWDQRLFALTELSDVEKGRLITLILALPRDDRELAVPKIKTVAVASLKQRLALAAAGVYWVAVANRGWTWECVG